jgi:transposase
MIPDELAAEIRRLFFAEHWKRGTIAAQLGVHHEVVERVIGRLGPAPKKAAGPGLLDPFKPFIAETLERYPRLVATRLFDMLRGRGYEGSLRTLRRWVRQVRPVPRREAFLRVERLPGEQAQIDWAHVGKLRVPGGERALWVFVMTMAYSRALWAELVLDLTVHSLLRSLVRAASYFGGLTRQWLFDNPKAVVLGRHGDAIRFHPALLELSVRLSVELRLCAPRKPQQKGTVERVIRFLKERFFAARTITAIERGNQELLEFIRDTADTRPHPTLQGISVAEAFTEEQPRLLGLPAAMPETNLIEPIKVDKTAFVRFDTNSYSVLPDFVEQTVTLVASDTEVRLLSTDQEIGRHRRCWGRKQTVEDLAHRSALLDQKRGAREPKMRDRLHAAAPRIDELYARWIDSGGNIGSITARAGKLLDLYGESVFRAAVHELCNRGSHDLGALSILCEKRRQRPASSLPLVLSAHVPDRDVVPHDLGGYDE